MEVFKVESQEVADKDAASPKVSIFGDRIPGDRKAESLPSAASSSSSDEEESSPVRSPPARRPRLRKGGNTKPVRPSRKTSTPGSTNYDMTCLERLIRTHSIWFQPRVNRDEVEELLAGKESGAFIVRQSSHNNTLALSVKSTEDKGLPEESIEHYLIQQSENSPTKLSLECSEHQFDNVLSLVYHYSTTKDELPSILALPASLREANSRQNLSSVALLGKDFWKYPMSSNNNENSLKSNKSPVPIRPRRKLSEPVNKVEATEATLEETLNGLQRVSDMLQASLKDLEEEPPAPSSPPIPPPRVSSSPQRVRKLSEISLSPQSQRKTSSNGDNTMDSLEMLRSNQPIVQLRTKLSEEMFGTTESSTTSSTKQWYSYYRSSIADKMSDYEDIWDATTQQRRKDSTNERCLSPAESEIQFKAYIASKLQDNELSSQCSSPTNTTQPRTSSSLDSMSNSSSSLKSSTESLVFSDENSEYTEVIYSDPLDALEKATDTRISDGNPDYDPNADQNEEAIYEEAGKKLVMPAKSSPTQSPKRRKRATISDTSVPILNREEKILQRRSHSYLMQSGPGKLSGRHNETKRLSAVLSRYIKPISKQSWQIDSSSWEFLNKTEETNTAEESTTETSKQIDSGLDSTLSFTETNKIKKTQSEEKSEDKDSVYESEMGTLDTNSAESQQYSKSSQLSETQQKIKDYIQSELNCDKWLFGKMVSQFLECTKQVHAQHILSTLRNVRQFMNGMKNYLIRHGEGDLHVMISEERTKLNSDQFLNVDLLLEESMNTLIIGPLTDYLRQSLQQHLQSIENKTVSALNTITEESEDSYKLKNARDKMAFEDCMRQVKDTLSPLDKLAHLLTGIKVVSNAVDEGDKDEKFCLLLASLIKDFQWLEVDLELLWSLLPTSVLRANGETTYHLTLVSSAININKTGKNPITDTTSSTSKTVDQPQVSTSSLKSCNSTTSQGSVSSPILTVYVPEKNTLASKNVPLRNENGKVKDVESLLTHMMAVANPTDHALYSIIDGQECLLSGEEQPLLIVDQARLQGKHFCAFAYQRKDSQNAWPTQMGLDLSKPTPTNCIS